MRIALLSSSRFGGAGIAAFRASQALHSIGVENDFFSLGLKSPNENSGEIEIRRTNFSAAKSRAVTLSQRILLQKNSDLITPISVNQVDVDLLKKNYDLIHIHSTYNILNHKAISNLVTSGKRIVITLHDQRWFTGGCHYSGDCRKYINECSCCPQATTIGKIIVNRSFIESNKVIGEARNVRVISPSAWLGDIARESKIFGGKQIEIIRNPIPDFIFDLDIGIREKEPRKKIAFIASNLQNPLKGLVTLQSALAVMSPSERERFELILIGNNAPDISEFPVLTRVLKSSSEQELVEILSQTNVLVVPSKQDNLPNVIGEAFSAGIKVIGSSAGGIAEVISKKSGEVFQEGNHYELAATLLRMDFDYPRSDVRSHFKEYFSFKTVGNQIHNFYTKDFES